VVDSSKYEALTGLYGSGYDQELDTLNQQYWTYETPGETISETPGNATQDRADDGAALMEGSLILDGRYRILRLLYQRPRLNLYLARRVVPGIGGIACRNEPLVAIRELVLTGLHAQVRSQIEAAAFEEFVSPIVLSAPRLPAGGDRVRVEGSRHYLVMQLQSSRSERHTGVVTLEELLLQHQWWPSWLSKELALSWGTQLGRIVARLHRLNVVLGDLGPATVLVDDEGRANWAPVLLVSWPPAPQFWRESASGPSAFDIYNSVFPVEASFERNAFAAPEMLKGICDRRSDVYSLGAILYLMLTRSAPVAPAYRLRAAPLPGGRERREDMIRYGDTGRRPVYHPASERVVGDYNNRGQELIAPRALNSQISPELERVLLRALALDPAQRYDTVFDLVEALEEQEAIETAMIAAHKQALLMRAKERLGLARLYRR
jgi:serine/threonine protein kinase